MRLYIPDLKKEEGKFIPFHVSIKLATGNTDDAVMDVRLEAAYVAQRVIIKGEWHVELEGECSRCLEKLTYPLKDSFYEEFIHLKSPADPKGFGEVKEPDKEERFVFKGDSLDLAEYFRQSFLMAQPLKMLCRTDCKGLCPVCGINKNNGECRCEQKGIDPRWAALEKLKGEL